MSRKLFLAVLVVLFGCGASFEPSWPPVDRPGLQRYVELSATIYSGGEPKTEEAFAFLAERGVKSILSVDGAPTKVDLARKYGMRYFHAPIGYDALDEEQRLRVFKAMQEAPKPVFVHCHHGRHRGPTAAMFGRILIDGASRADALNEMKRIGTSPKYTGLYKTVEGLELPPAKIISAQPSVPEQSKVDDIAKGMAALDRHWDQVKFARKRNWEPDPDHPDISLPHEALQSAELLTEMHRFSGDKARDFIEWMKESRDGAWALEKALRAKDKAAAEAAYKSAAKSCKACHDAYRN